MRAGQRQQTKRRLAVGLLLLTIAASGCDEKKRPDPGPEGMVSIEELTPGLLIAAKYAGTDNFVGRRLYPREEIFILPEAGARLSRVERRLREEGYRLKVYDAYRPLSVQKRMWSLVPDERYVANPEKGSMHNRGCAVDVTLVTAAGEPLEMPTAYDDFSERAHLDFAELPEEALRNRETLQAAMKEGGFVPLATEWWHFAAEGCESRPVLDVNPWGEPLFPDEGPGA